MNNINAKMIKVDEDVLPFVEIKFKGIDGKIYSALMLMDTGSNFNILATEMKVLIGKDDWLEESLDGVVNVANEVSELSQAMFKFEMDNQKYQEQFAFVDGQHLIQIDDMMFVGILGNRFMQKYRLAIDYANMTVHTSNVTAEELNNGKYEFVIQIPYGLKHYNTPILHIKGEKHSAVAVVDTGCDEFTITQRAIDECGLSPYITGNTVEVTGSNGSVDGQECVLNFSLTDHKGNRIGKQSFEETVEIIPTIPNVLEDEECDEDGKLLPPVDGMIGSPFIAKQKWILDFGEGAIYKM